MPTSYQQWNQELRAAPRRPVAINTGGYIFRGRVEQTLFGPEVIDGWGRKHVNCGHWSWSASEPEVEMLMVKPHGIFMAHWWNEAGHLLRIIQDMRVGMFVEIGVLDGGLASLLLSVAEYDPMFRYVGVNLGVHHVDARVVNKMRDLNRSRIRAELHDMDAWEPATVQMVAQELRRSDGRAMVYCDGGNKELEAHLYWDILRPRDLLGVHDYSDDPQVKGPEVFPHQVSDLLVAGDRIGQEELRDTRILLLERP
jgi:hypothetical protein